MMNLGKKIRRMGLESSLCTHRRDQRAGPIGLDFGSRCIKAVQLRRDDFGHMTMASEIKDVPGDIQNDWQGHLDKLAALIKEMIAAGDFLGREVVGCIPDRLLEYRNIRLTPESSGDLDSAVLDYAATEMKLPPDQFTIQFYDCGEVWDHDESRREIIAMAAPVPVVDDYLSLLKRSGLLPVAVDAIPTALARSLGTSAIDDAPHVLLDVGYRSTCLTITHHNEIRFVKRFETGMGLLDQGVADTLDLSVEQAEGLRRQTHRNTHDSAEDQPIDPISDAISATATRQGEQLVQGITKCLQYFSVTFRESRPNHGFIFGGGAQEKVLVDLLNEKSGVHFESVESLAKTDWVRTAQQSSPKLLGQAEWVRSALAVSDVAPPSTWAVAVGLALNFTPTGDEGNNP